MNIYILHRKECYDEMISFTLPKTAFDGSIIGNIAKILQRIKI